jgi:hypothetical protein
LKIIFLINPNGYGHLFRVIDIIKFLNKKIKFKIYCSNIHRGKIKKELKLKCKINTFTTVLDLKKDPFNNLEKLAKKNIITKSDLIKYDIIISDNLINLNVPFAKFYLMANFLWSETNTKKTLSRKKYLKIENEFFSKYNNKIICNKFFSTNKIESYKNLKIDFTGQKFNQSKINNRILFYHSPGDYYPHKLLRELRKKGFEVFSNLQKTNNYVKYINLEKNENFLRDVSIIISKPGLGIIKDIIRYKKIFFVIFKRQNNEYLNNFLKLKKYRLINQKKYNNENEILENILKFKKNKKHYNKSNLNIFKFDGAKTIYNYINNAK